MSGLVVLSIACAAFVAGFTFGLMFLAVVRSHYEKGVCGEPEGDQTTKFDQGSSL